MHNIYGFICDNGILSEKHREELKTKRGFSDETIKNCRFFSGGDYLLKIEGELSQKFPLELLLKSGICINTGKPTLSPALLQDRIIIPFLDNSIVTLLYPHRFALKNVPLQIYQTTWDKNIILTESPFKAVAAKQMGFNAIGIPGVGAFSKEHFPELIKLLNEHKVRDICIIFDSQDKNDPRYPLLYNSNPAEQHDTEYYAYLMAYLLEREGKRVRIGILPDSWRVNGKIDLDGALAQGKTYDDIAAIIALSLSYQDYFSELPKEVQTIIRKKKDKRYFKSHINITHGCYTATRWRNGEPFPEEISNFTINIIAIHDTKEGLIREVVFTHKGGDKSRAFSILAEQMNNDTFKTFCLSVGNYVWKGRPDDLMMLWESEFVNAEDMRFITEPDHVGWLEDEKIWIFANVGITEDGKELRPDENGIFWREKKGIKPIGIVITTGRNTVNSGIPSLNLTEFDINELKDKLADTIGSMQTQLCLGWIIANMFMHEIFYAHGCFPFLYLRGMKGSGKTKILSWLLACLGIEGEGYAIESTTAVAAGRYLSYFSSLPVLFDDYRNNEKCQSKDGFFRNCYNRQSAGKGLRTEFGIREVKIRGSVCFGGEETPHDAALMERCVSVFISEKLRKKEHLQWFMNNKINFSYLAYNILRRRKELRKRFIDELNKAYKYLSEKCNARVAVNFAIIAAGYTTYFGDDALDFAEWLIIETKRASLENQSESMVSLFLDDLMPLKLKGQIKDDYWVIDENKIYLYLHGLYKAWAKEYSQEKRQSPFKESAIRDYLRDEPGFLHMMMDKRIKGNNLSCIVFDLETAPLTIKNLVSFVGVSEQREFVSEYNSDS